MVKVTVEIDGRTEVFKGERIVGEISTGDDATAIVMGDGSRANAIDGALSLLINLTKQFCEKNEEMQKMLMVEEAATILKESVKK